MAIGAILLVVGGGTMFTTGTEWVSVRLGLSQSSTGSLFAALATTLPETLIPVLAILQGRGESVGRGVILGGPITLTTLGVFLLGASATVYAVRGTREPPLTVDHDQVKYDLRVFLVGFSVAILVTFLRSDIVPIAGSLLLLALYLRYLYHTSEKADDTGPIDPEALEMGNYVDRVARVFPCADADRDYGSNPPNELISIQVAVAVGMLLVGSQLLIRTIEWASETVIPIPAVLVALLVAPVVSNLPEYIDGVIWVSQRKDSLAVEQLTGTLAFQGQSPYSSAFYSLRGN